MAGSKQVRPQHNGKVGDAHFVDLHRIVTDWSRRKKIRELTSTFFATVSRKAHKRVRRALWETGKALTSFRMLLMRYARSVDSVRGFSSVLGQGRQPGVLWMLIRGS